MRKKHPRPTGSARCLALLGSPTRAPETSLPVLHDGVVIGWPFSQTEHDSAGVSRAIEAQVWTARRVSKAWSLGAYQVDSSAGADRLFVGVSFKPGNRSCHAREVTTVACWGLLGVTAALTVWVVGHALRPLPGRRDRRRGRKPPMTTTRSACESVRGYRPG